MLLFGPVTIITGSTTLGDTFGGVTLSLITKERVNVGNYNKEELVIGGEGTVNFYNWPTSVTIATATNPLVLYDFAVVTLENAQFKITLYACKITLEKDFSIGKNEQQPFKCHLVFKPDVSGNVIKIE